MVNETLADRLRTNGFALLRRAVSADLCDRLLGALEPLIATGNARRGGTRLRLLESTDLRRQLEYARTGHLAERALGRDAFPVRVLLFDKTATANWKVGWHQDLTIAVRRRIPTAGFESWSEKDGIVHVRPPVHVLEGMVTVRVHLDDCPATNGPLRVLPGSHRSGRMSVQEMDRFKAMNAEVRCPAQRGDVLVMHPLLLHASSSSQTPDHRRVLHIEYGCDALPGGLEWFEQPVQPTHPSVRCA